MDCKIVKCSTTLENNCVTCGILWEEDEAIPKCPRSIAATSGFGGRASKVGRETMDELLGFLASPVAPARNMDGAGCRSCGLDYVGDGYTSVMHCPNAPDTEDMAFAAPDEGPFDCNYPDNLEID